MPNFQSINPGDSVKIKLYFRPAALGTFTGQIGFVSRAIGENTLSIDVAGATGYIPSSPFQLSVTLHGENAILNWSPVTTSASGQSITISRYLIYFRTTGTGPWCFLAATIGENATTFTHSYVVTYSRTMYYQVTAWIGDNTDSFDSVIGSVPVGTPKNEVERMLNGAFTPESIAKKAAVPKR